MPFLWFGRSTPSAVATRLLDSPAVATPGPLAVRWGTLTLEPPRAGALGRARVDLDNVGTAAWRTLGRSEGVRLSYHWLDELGNPIVWDGIRTELAQTV